MKKIILIAAVLLLVFMGYGYTRWLLAGGTPAASWQTLTSDWLLVTVAADIVTFNLVCLVYFFRDVNRQTQFSTLGRATWMVSILCIGAPAFLAYLVLRKE